MVSRGQSQLDSDQVEGKLDEESREYQFRCDATHVCYRRGLLEVPKDLLTQREQEAQRVRNQVQCGWGSLVLGRGE